jgi:hypothetical protein
MDEPGRIVDCLDQLRPGGHCALDLLRCGESGLKLGG